MNIIVNIDKNTIANKQPKLYDLGEVTTSIQDLLDNSSITITNYRTIVLQFIDVDLSIKQAFLNLNDYSEGDKYGLGQNILESDLIYLSGGGGVQSVTGDIVTGGNTPNPIINLESIPLANLIAKGMLSSNDYKKLNIIPTYANNASAQAGGVPVGSFYQKDDGSGNRFVMIVTEDA